ncbi:GNAT family N-acetyltransferase [Amycolatopsis rhabdoformis]|uniref:GNAT family N-acetyltransferase n=1 Tax=Amycolatopsis rhabdoformis TaxID=1448059 RepID=A0ABZ1I9G3_9PSEU|nr:GNAT family N-acetyltransferase [Amycolatopsis rhabdoformis]WSE30233.1 GNAT family N-acetyltransferase [Amycolatopsis rhabdoformis]
MPGLDHVAASASARPASLAAAVRPAVVADAPGIAHVHVASWQAAYAGLIPDDFLAGLSTSAREGFWTQTLATPQARHSVLVAETPDGTIAGFAASSPSRDDDATPDTGELASIYLLPEFWSRGYGRTLHAHALTALATDFPTATLWVLAGNTRARGFYERTGWTLDGRTKVESVANGTVTLEEVRYRISPRL